MTRLTPVLRAVLSEPRNLWDNGKTLTYAFLQKNGTTLQQRKVRKVINIWEDYANIKFLRTDDVSTAIIRISFIPGTTSWSHIGKKIREKTDITKPTMNLGSIEDTADISDIDKGVILHEFGHALGMLHEHQSPALGGLITLKEVAVVKAFESKRWSRKQVEDQILNRYSEANVTNFTEFDPKSVMMYYMPREMNNQNIDLPANNTLSKFDKAFMAIHYPFFGPNPPKPDARIDNALKILGIGEDGISEVLALYQNGDSIGIREKVKEIYVSVRTARQKVLVDKFAALASYK